jgi:glyoxylase-like metal-dependent hydrolase (beta-lactamase superfamily II)
MLSCALMLLNLGASAQGRRMEGELEVIPVRDNIYLGVMEPAGNIALSIGEDGVLMVDNQFAPMTGRILDTIKQRTDRPLRYVINTHWHGDHTGGNFNLGNLGVPIVAHDNVHARLNSVQYHLLFRTGTRPHPPEALPAITYHDSMSLHFNGEEVELIHLPVSHTDGDTAIYFREADVLHTGDAFINRGYPLIDVASGGTIKGQIESTNRLIELITSDTIVIPGHGPLADRRRLIEVRNMLQAARESVVALIDQGLSSQEIRAADPLAELNPEWEQGFVRSRAFVNIIYQSETGDWSVPAPDEIQRWDE